MAGQQEQIEQGEAITFINPKQVRNFMDIEKLIEKKVPKLNLPKRFEAAPKYQILAKEKKKRSGRIFKRKIISIYYLV